jgi:hypothetical protein
VEQAEFLMARLRRQSTKLLDLKRHARNRGWLKWLRTGEGEEADERALLSGHWFNPERGEHAVQWIERYCKLVEGAWRGHDFRLLDWQWDLLMRLFGWVRWSSEWERFVRRFRWLYLEVPKKNGKSPTGAYVGLYTLCADGEFGAGTCAAATAASASEARTRRAIIVAGAYAAARPPPSARPAIIKRAVRFIVPPHNPVYSRPCRFWRSGRP